MSDLESIIDVSTRHKFVISIARIFGTLGDISCKYSCLRKAVQIECKQWEEYFVKIDHKNRTFSLIVNGSLVFAKDDIKRQIKLSGNFAG